MPGTCAVSAITSRETALGQAKGLALTRIHVLARILQKAIARVQATRCRPPPHTDPARCLRSLWRQRDDRQPGFAQSRRCVGNHAGTGASGRARTGLCAQQDCGGAGLATGKSGGRHHSLHVQHGLPRGDDGNFRDAGRYRPATRGGHHQLQPRTRRGGAV
ncbi:UNVERIFIED_CONTAM: hypothetical protein NCL1_00708 [Trichonephila clavipes]